MAYLRSIRSGAVIAALATLLLLLFLAWRIGDWYELQLQNEQRAAVAVEIASRGNALTAIMNRRLTRLQALHSFVQAEADNADFAALFTTYAAGLSAGGYGIRNIAVGPGSVIQYVYPLTGNESVLGYNPLFDERPAVRVDAQQAIVTGEIVLTGPTDLVQGGTGLIARQAVQRNGRYWGLVNIVLDVPLVLAEAGVGPPQPGAPQQVADLQFALRDGAGNVFSGPPELFDADPLLSRVQVGDEQWELAATPLGGWSGPIANNLLIYRGAALSISTLLALIVFITVDHQSRLSQALEHRARLLNIGRSLASTLELEPLLEQILEQLSGVVESKGVAVLRLDETGTALKLLAYRSPASAGRLPSHFPLREGTMDYQVIHTAKPVIIADPTNGANRPLLWYEWLDEEYLEQLASLRSLLAVPLLYKNRVVGMITFGHDEPGYYTEHHADLALAFGSQAAVAIENARLYEQARSLAALQERQRLARDLHDSVSQALYGIALGSRTARTMVDRAQLNVQQASALAAPLDYVLSLAEAALTEMRALIFELRPESLEVEGLVAALTRQADALRVRHSLEVAISFAPEPELSLAAKEALYRVAQEALNNVVRHAAARRVEISLQHENGCLLLEICDDGRGFDAAQSFPGHLGLHSMRERLQAIGGTLEIESTLGAGTRVQVEIRDWENRD